jgi:predicted RNA binding protein YcfA (HicA-like mRNA interferase family)
LPKLPRLTPQEAEKMLFTAGFSMIRSKGSHRVYMKDNKRIVIPFHTGKILHPKIVKQILRYTGNNENA